MSRISTDSSSPEAATTADVARRLETQGWAKLPPEHTQPDLQSFATTLDALRARFGHPPLHRKGPEWLAENVEVAGPGLAFYGLLGFAPELASRLFTPSLVAALRAILGDDMHLELVGAVLSDEGRRFTEWETHLGGVDDERWRREGRRPVKSRVERVVAFLFLEALTEETGPWRVLPRAVGEPVEPPRSIHEPEWPGAVSITCEAGCVLLLDESTWHSVTPRRVPGVRRFIGAYFAVADVEPTVGRDPSLEALGGVGGPLEGLARRD